MPKITEEEAASNVLKAIAESVEDMSEEELREEFRLEGRDPDVAAEELRQHMLRGSMSAELDEIDRVFAIPPLPQEPWAAVLALARLLAPDPVLEATLIADYGHSPEDAERAIEEGHAEIVAHRRAGQGDLIRNHLGWTQAGIDKDMRRLMRQLERMSPAERAEVMAAAAAGRVRSLNATRFTQRWTGAKAWPPPSCILAPVGGCAMSPPRPEAEFIEADIFGDGEGFYGEYQRVDGGYRGVSDTAMKMWQADAYELQGADGVGCREHGPSRRFFEATRTDTCGGEP